MSVELARRAVACKNWRWLAGMRVVDASDQPRSPQRLGEKFSVPLDAREWLPDFDDPATRGCLIALVREAWGDAMLFAFPDAFPDRWTVVDVDCGYHATEAEALVAALEVAP